MNKNIKNQEGINLVSLSIAVIVILAIAGTVLYNVRTNLGVQKLKAMQADIENLRGKVANYYLQYGAIPTLNVYNGNEKQVTSIDKSIINDVIENAASNELDTGDYYVIDLKAMENITLTYGEDYEELNGTSSSAENIQTLANGTLTDVYIINSVSHNIFYVHGITYEGKTYYAQYQDDEINKIGDSNFNINIESKVAKDEKGNVIYTVDKGERVPGNRNAIYKDDDENVAVIPAGFTVSDVKVVNENTGVIEKDETSIENGLVVRDKSENEWVWIPVSSSDLALMYTQDNTGWTMLGTSAPNEVVTKYKSLGVTLGSITLDRTDPGLTADPYYREPDVLSSYDTNQTNLTQAGFSDLLDMATKLKDDYKDMIGSVKKNGGFYVGRYELGKDAINNPQVKAGPVMNNTNWYKLYKACKSFSNGNVRSRMIWGCQWDQVCRFIKGNGENSIIDNSISYGNYNNSTGDATTNSGTSNFNNTTGQLNDNWKIKNIYDMAGNCWEWTQEAYNTSRRSNRGR